jgi:hypothetical protein
LNDEYQRLIVESGLRPDVLQEFLNKLLKMLFVSIVKFNSVDDALVFDADIDVATLRVEKGDDGLGDSPFAFVFFDGETVVFELNRESLFMLEFLSFLERGKATQASYHRINIIERVN